MMSHRATSSVECRKQPIIQLAGFLCERLRLLLQARTWALCVAAFAGGLVLAAPAAHATPVTEPTALSPGDQYRLAFVTSTTRDATSSDIADYNAFVTGVATSVPELNALGTTWKAIVSTPSVDARDNTNTNPTTSDPSVPIYLLDGTRKIADDNSDLWDSSIDSSMSIMESGAIISATQAFTGTNILGQGVDSFELGTSVGGVVVGRTSSQTGNWIHSVCCVLTSDTLPFYAMSDVLTISDEPNAIPEPRSLALMGLGLLGLAAARRRLSTLHRA